VAAASRALYRARQFFVALRPNVDGDAWVEASALLSEGERKLFRSMMPRDQQHCLDTYRWLRKRWHQDPDLLTAALLHDVGKGRIALWHRVLFVILKAAAPWLLPRVVMPGDGAGWRHALYRCQHHEELGAGLLREAGSSEMVIALVRGDAGAGEERLAALHAADEAC